MALIIVMSKGDFQIYCRSVKEKVENDLLSEMIFSITILSVMVVFFNLERCPFATPN